MIEPRRTSERVSFLVFLAVLVAGFAWMMRPFWNTAGIAAVTAVLFLPIHERIVKRCKGRRYVAALLSLLVLCIFLLLPVGALAAVVASEIFRFTQGIAPQLQGGQLATILDHVNQFAIQQAQKLGELAPTDIDLKGKLIAAANELGTTIVQYSPKVVTSTADIGLATALWMLFVVVLLSEGAQLFRFFMDLSPLASAHELQIAREVREMITANFIAIVAVAAANGVLVWIAFGVAPIDRALMWGIVTFGLSFVPLIGAAAVWITASIYLWTTGHSGWALGLVIFWLAVVAQIDNVLKPLLMRGRVNIHPVLLVLSLLGGAKTMGPTGLIFGPVFVAILQACLRIWRREFAPPPDPPMPSSA